MSKETKDFTEQPADGNPPRPPEDDEIEILEIEGFEEPGGNRPAASADPGEPLEIEATAGDEDLRSRVATLEREKDQAQERLLRQQADLENARKRLVREKEEFHRLAVADLVGKLLPVLDNLERALSVPAEGSGDALHEGIRLVRQQLLDVLKKEGLEPVDTGIPFDPNQHEAVLREETAEREPDEILEVLQGGYFFRKRLIRPAMVKVAVPPPAPEPASESGDGTEESDTEAD